MISLPTGNAQAREPVRVQPAVEIGRRSIRRLVRGDPDAHRHLGWIPPLEWLGREPFLALSEGRRLRAVLACPPDEEGRIWLRLFAVDQDVDTWEAWEQLWGAAVKELRDMIHDDEDIQAVNVLVLRGWLEGVLRRSGFEQINAVVVLDWDAASGKLPEGIPLVQIRPLVQEDLEDVYRIDSVSFGPVWRHTRNQLRHALQEAEVVTGAVDDEGKLLGYQISTSGTLGGHLARLAVWPETRGRGIGKALVADLLDRFQRRGHVRVTVNTQEDNAASLEIYRQFGFVRQEPAYPVYSFRLGARE